MPFWLFTTDAILVLKSNDFPFAAVILMSGSEVFKKPMLKVRNPEKPESTINKAKVPIITPTAAIKVMILMVLLLLFENKYRFAM